MTVVFMVFGFGTSVSEFIRIFGLDNIVTLKESSFWGSALSKIVGAGGIAALGGTVVASKFTNVSPVYIIKSIVFMTPLAALILDFIGIMTKLNETGQTWLYWGFAIFLFPFIVGYAITLAEWWEGRD